MEGNPYTSILGTMRRQAHGQIPTVWRLGEVKSTDPLQVEVSNTIQGADRLLKNAEIGELHSGDTVVVLPVENDQKHIILCRVVSA